MKQRLEKAAALCYSVKMSGIRRETASGRAAGAAKVNDMTDDSGNDFNEIGSGCFLSPQGGFL